MSSGNNDFEDGNPWRCTNHSGIPGESFYRLYLEKRDLEAELRKMIPTDLELEEYPALKDAWENYLIIKNLINKGK